MNRCVIRRTQQLLKEYLPVKFEYMVFCKLTQTQEAIYRYLVRTSMPHTRMHPARELHALVPLLSGEESGIANRKEEGGGGRRGHRHELCSPMDHVSQESLQSYATLDAGTNYITGSKRIRTSALALFGVGADPDLLFVDADDDGRPGARGKPSAKIGKAFNQASVLALYPPDMRPSIGAQATYTSSSRGGGHSSFRPELSGILSRSRQTQQVLLGLVILVGPDQLSLSH